jgi:hypothetical protein
MAEGPRVVGYRSAEKVEATLAQTVALYVGVFCAVGVGMVVVCAGAAWVLSLFSVHVY